MDRPQKVVAYIIRDDKLLVFRHPDDKSFDESGIQVPAGTVRTDEVPADAVLREAREETGLSEFRIERYLGVGEYDMRPYANFVAARHYFHLSVDGDVPDRWDAYELGDGLHEPIRFELYWLPVAQAHVIAGGQAAFLGRVFD
jgi:8-oxo-dGTP diphosphatase